jgi:hypothetical protein
MVNVRNRVAAWEQRQAPLSDELQSFLDLVWSHRKDQSTGTYAATNADVYGLYTRAQRNFGVGQAAMIGFLNGILRMPELPEIQCDLEDEDDALGDFLWTYFNATKADSGFALLDRQNFSNLVNLARTHSDVCSALAQTFYHFRRNLTPSADRIYLHAKPLHAIRVMEFIVTQMVCRPDVHPGLSNAKVGAPGAESRFDTIVIYLANATAVAKALDEIAAYQHAGSRVWFEPGTTRSTKLITNHKGIELTGVGIGAEPPVALYQHNKDIVTIPGASSFGSFRSKLIQFALANTLQSGQGKVEFVNRVIGYFNSVGINPRQPHTHGIQSELRYRAKVTLQQLRNGIEPTWKVS